MANNKIGVVTITFNSASVIGGFMQSLLVQTHSDFVTYVVDNSSEDDTLALIDNFNSPNVRVIANKNNIGVAAGNNQGILASLRDGCDYVLLINNDVEFAPNLFSGLITAMTRHQSEMIVPKIYFYDPPKMIWCAGGRFDVAQAYATVHTGEGQMDTGQFDAPGPISYAPTCCMLIKKDVFERIGMMDEKYFVYYDDTDFCYRALKAGVNLCYEPSISLHHKVSSLTGGKQSPFSLRFGPRNKTYFIRKHFSFPLSWLWLAVYQVFFLARFLTGRDSWQVYLTKLRSFHEGLQIAVDRSKDYQPAH